MRKGPANQRKLTGISTVEFPSKVQRDTCLNAMKGGIVLFEGVAAITAVPAKTKKQLHRNWAVNCALEMVQKEQVSGCTKVVAANWAVNAHRGHRTITIDGVIAFEQLSADVAGHFKNACAHLTLP